MNVYTPFNRLIGKHAPISMTYKHVFVDRFPPSLATTLCLLRRSVRLSRELADDVVRARGHIDMNKLRLEDNAALRYNPYFDGKRHGLSLGWHDNGVRHWERFFVDGKQHGLTRGWHMNGVRKWECFYVDGNPHGLSRGWHPNGVHWWETAYVDGGKRHERWWHPNGIEEVNFRSIL